MRVIVLVRGRLLVRGMRVVRMLPRALVLVPWSLVLVTRRRDERRVDQLHAALRAAVGLLAHDLGVHRAHVRHRGRDRDELHAALGTAVGLLAHDLGMHRADVDDVALGRAHVHLRDERERLVRRRVDVGLEPLPFGRPLRVHAQNRELVCERRRRRLRGDVDRARACRCARASGARAPSVPALRTARPRRRAPTARARPTRRAPRARPGRCRRPRASCARPAARR